MSSVIKFYSHVSGSHKCLSNFYDSPIVIEGIKWKTSEHYYHAQKFPSNPKYQQLIRDAATPYESKSLGKSKKYNMDPNWKAIKQDVMYDACYAKFSQNEEIKKILLLTGDKILVEDSPTDYIWGGRGSGLNLLGTVLSKVRTKLKSEEQFKDRNNNNKLIK